jgi:hypothetical protein
MLLQDSNEYYIGSATEYSSSTSDEKFYKSIIMI